MSVNVDTDERHCDTWLYFCVNLAADDAGRTQRWRNCSW